jgi:hypothetical protein
MLYKLKHINSNKLKQYGKTSQWTFIISYSNVIHIVFWVVMPWNVTVGYQCFEGPWCLHHPEGGSMVLRYNGILLQHYMTSQTRPPLKSSMLWKSQFNVSGKKKFTT